MFQRGGRGSTGSCEGMEPEQELESPFLRFLSTHTFPGMHQAPHHPFNNDCINPHYLWQVDWSTRYFYMSINTSWHPRWAEVGTITWIWRGLPIPWGGTMLPKSQLTSPRSWHPHQAFWWGPPWCPYRCNKMPWWAPPTSILCYDDFNESNQFGASPYSGWLTYGHLRRCYKCRRLKVVVATSTQFYWHWSLCRSVHSHLRELLIELWMS